MKILYLLTEIEPSGAEKIVYDLASCAIKEGHTVGLLALQPLNEKSEMMIAFRKLSIKIFSLNLSKINWLGIFKYKKIIKEFAPNIVHSHLYHPNIISRLFSSKRNYTLINTIHIMEYRKSKFLRFILDRITFNRCDIHTAVSQSVADFQAKKLHCDSKKIKVVLNGIAKPEKMTDELILTYKKQFDIENCNKVIGAVGRLNHQKGFDIILDMLDKISTQIPKGEKWAFLFIGEGIERKNLEKIAENAPQNIKVVMPGYFSNAPQLIGMFDLFIMPSRSEGFGLVLSEAMSHGVAILVNNVSCLSEVLSDYSNGEVINFFDSQNDVATKIVNATINSKKITYNSPYTNENMYRNYMNLI